MRDERLVVRRSLGWSAIRARSVALAGFGLDSLIEIGASVVVVWELTGTDEGRQRVALRLIGGAFALLGSFRDQEGSPSLRQMGPSRPGLFVYVRSGRRSR